MEKEIREIEEIVIKNVGNKKQSLSRREAFAILILNGMASGNAIGGVSNVANQIREEGLVRKAVALADDLIDELKKQ